MAMTIGEASTVSTVLRAVTGDSNVTHEDLVEAFEYLNERAAKPLQGRIVRDGHDLAAAVRLTQHAQDAL